MSEDILEKAKLNAILKWNGRGEVPPIIWNNMSQSDRRKIENDRIEAMPDGEGLGVLTLVMALSCITVGTILAIEWQTFMGFIFVLAVSLIIYILTMLALHLRYWTMARPPSTSSLIKWEAEEDIIIKVEKGVRQEGELTESQTE